MAQRRELHDPYFKKAKAEGYLARSAYKLLEINERRPVLRAADRVLDLGCAPGSWLQVASQLVGPKGVVVGVDLQEVRHRFEPNVRTFVGDVYTAPPAVLLGELGGEEERFDSVLSDMAPNTSGSGDDFMSVRLCRRVLELLPPLLRVGRAEGGRGRGTAAGGNCVMKVLEGEGYMDLLREVQGQFESARGFKPKASREVSREMYIIAHGYLGGRGGRGSGDRGKGHDGGGTTVPR